MNGIKLEPDFRRLRFLHNIFSNKDYIKVNQIIKDRCDRFDVFHHPFMYLNGRNLAYFFSENSELLKLICQKVCDSTSRHKHIFLYDFEGNHCLSNCIK